MRIAAFVLIAVSLSAGAVPSARRLDGILASTPASRRAHWGILVVDAATGKTVYSHNASHYFVPASNTKLLTTALALERLGPTHHMTTRVVASSPPDSAGVIHGDLRLVGGGDPSLSGRAYPYRKEAQPANPLAAIEEFAEAVYRRGVRRITGDVVGDDTAYVWAPYPPGWAMDDAVWEYGAPVSALAVNDNAVRLIVEPGERAGEPAYVFFEPPLAYYIVDNRTRTGEGPPIRASRATGSRELLLRGSVPPGGSPYREWLAVDDPARYAAFALYDALARRGVSIDGRPVAAHRWADSVADLRRGAPEKTTEACELARRDSPPLVDLLKVVNKVSQNLHAELLLRETARMRRNVGSREAGLEELKSFLHEVGVDEHGYAVYDGSGLSRLNLLTPETVVRLLLHMYRSPHREAWMETLPVGGEDGTLSSRFRGAACSGRVRAKTGTLTHVSALSGYLERYDKRRWAFAIFVNNYEVPSSSIREVMDRLVAALL